MSDDEQLQQFGRLVTDDEWEELYRLRSRQNAYFHESRAKLEAKLNELGRTHPPALQDWMREHDYKFEPDSLAVDGPQWRIYERRRCVQSALRGWALLAVLVALTLAALWIVVSIVF